MSISELGKWRPFKVDALGLVTLLGTEDVDHSVGRLSHGHFTEYLPLVAPHVIAGDDFRKPILGFTLYNLTDGICASDLSGWFARWLLFQNPSYSSTTFIVNVCRRSRSSGKKWIPSLCVAVAAAVPLLVLPVLFHDWWGMANAISLVVSVLVKSVVVKANRDGVDLSAATALRQSNAPVKVVLKMPTGCTVALHGPRGVITECLLTTSRPAWPSVYFAFRMLGWVAFLVHVLSLGMAALPDQLLTVTILAVSTICVISGVGSDRELIGSSIVIKRTDDQPTRTSMAAFFARLNLTAGEEDALVDWNLMPQRRNHLWWRKYRDCIAQNNLQVFDSWKLKRTWIHHENLMLEEARAVREAANQGQAAVASAA